MMLRKLLIVVLAALPCGAIAQFAPEAGQPGSTAVHADSAAIVAWATRCSVERGWQQIDNPSLGKASYGRSADAIGKADNKVVSLGDGGVAVLEFETPICNREGADFVVFENGFHSTPHVFLELAFVEVSSDGLNYVRFPAVSNVPYDEQTGTFDATDASLIHNLAGKYEVLYGTPFDLDEVEDLPSLDKNKITHVRIVDVVGTVDAEYASLDSEGRPVNDPWPTPFESSGFDLDAVGVIHDIGHFSLIENDGMDVSFFPNPVQDVMRLSVDEAAIVAVCNPVGQVLARYPVNGDASVDMSSYQPGIYIVKLILKKNVKIIKILKL